MLYSRNTNISGNIIKLNLRTSMNEQTHFFIKIYLSLFILERVDVSVVCERWVERHILREGTSSSHIFYRESGGANTWTPFQVRQRHLWSAACPMLDWFSALCLNLPHMVLITWSPSGYTTVVPDYSDHAVSFTNHNVTACQSTWGHKERAKNPWHILYNIPTHTHTHTHYDSLYRHRM